MIISTSFTISAVLAILVGIVIMIWPKILNLAVGLYLIITGLINLINF